jgi:3-oxoacyl-(acyl-carrier-protein) synthase
MIAIAHVFDMHQPTITGNKGAIGHTVAASGLNNLIFTAKAMQEGVVSPVADLTSPMKLDAKFV